MKNTNFKFLIFLLFLNQSIFGMYNMIEDSESNENISEDSIRVVLTYNAMQDSIKVKLQTSVVNEISQEWNVDWRDRKCSYCMEQLYQGDRDIHLFACGNPLHAAHPECYTRHREIRQRDNDSSRPIPCPVCRKITHARITSPNTSEVTLSMARENFTRQTATLMLTARELAPREHGLRRNNINNESVNITILPVENPIIDTNNSRRRGICEKYHMPITCCGTIVLIGLGIIALDLLN